MNTSTWQFDMDGPTIKDQALDLSDSGGQAINTMNQFFFPSDICAMFPDDTIAVAFFPTTENTILLDILPIRDSFCPPPHGLGDRGQALADIKPMFLWQKDDPSWMGEAREIQVQYGGNTLKTHCQFTLTTQWKSDHYLHQNPRVDSLLSILPCQRLICLS